MILIVINLNRKSSPERKKEYRTETLDEIPHVMENISGNIEGKQADPTKLELLRPLISITDYLRLFCS